MDRSVAERRSGASRANVCPYSVFDIFKIGVGPSSSHTLGPWLAALDVIDRFKADIGELTSITAVEVELYGSLALTGMGHQSHKAIVLGLMGCDPKTVDTDEIDKWFKAVERTQTILLGGVVACGFDLNVSLTFNKKRSLKKHPNGMVFKLYHGRDRCWSDRYYSTGGGFIEKEETEGVSSRSQPAFVARSAQDLLMRSLECNKSIAQLVEENELQWADRPWVYRELKMILHTMQVSVFKGLRAKGTLPGGLKVKRRAQDMAVQLLGHPVPTSSQDLLTELKSSDRDFREVQKWVSTFALAVNEENAAMGRIVTSPTNGAAGVIPSILLYAMCFEDKNEADALELLMTAAEIGALFIKSATISAAMGGCQAEIGVSSAMAAGGLCHVLGGTTAQVLEAAEIAMEHHLGLTCDPVAGLVQVPCIERNAMGAIKAIAAADLALARAGSDGCVSLDEVIETMWLTAQDMSLKYKETSRGGLALSVRHKEC